MSSDRRFVLKGLAAAGLAVSTTSWARAVWSSPAGLEQPPRAVTTLVGGSALDAAFLAGVRQAVDAAGQSAPLAHPLRGLEAATFQQLDALLRDREASLLLGWLDDASAVLVLDLVRSAGGQVLSVQHHRIDHDAAAGVRVQALGQALVAGQPFQPSAQPQGVAYVSLRCVI